MSRDLTSYVTTSPRGPFIDAPVDVVRQVVEEVWPEAYTAALDSHMQGWFDEDEVVDRVARRFVTDADQRRYYPRGKLPGQVKRHLIALAENGVLYRHSGRNSGPHPTPSGMLVNAYGGYAVYTTPEHYRRCSEAHERLLGIQQGAINRFIALHRKAPDMLRDDSVVVQHKPPARLDDHGTVTITMPTDVFARLINGWVDPVEETP